MARAGGRRRTGECDGRLPQALVMEQQQQHAGTPSARAVFDHTVELRSPAERAAYLMQACGDDAAVRARVDGLLAAYEAAGSFLESPPPNVGRGGAETVD